jgi:exonuclease SbcD
VRLLHTADVHLDAPNGSLGSRAADLRRRTWEAWERTIEAALAHQVQLFIIAGDLFDTRTPAAKTVDRALRSLQRLTGATPAIHVILLPGTHDCWSEGGFWDSPAIRVLPESVHVLGGPGGSSLALPHLGATVHGCPHRCDLQGQRPLCELRADPDAAINIGVIHASPERGDVQDGAQVSSSELAGSRMDYVALGHWHRWQDCSEGGVTAIMPGSIEVPGFGSWDRGSVALVTLGEGPVCVQRLEIGTLQARELSVDAGDLRGTEDLVAVIEAHADPDLLLDVRLTGLGAAGTLLDLDAAMERLSGAFFALRITDRSHPALDALAEEHLDPKLTLGRFVELARARIDAACDEQQRRVAERALQIGVSMLRRTGGAE